MIRSPAVLFRLARHYLKGPANTFLAGLLASLPLILTFILIGWVANILKRFLGPDSFLGHFLAAIGLQIVDDQWTAYVLGALLFAGAIFVLGMVVQTRLRSYVQAVVDRTVRRVPVIGTLYDATDRFIGMFDRSQKADLAAMSPVWCTFGGGDGVTVLALMPNPEIIELSGKPYRTVLVPTAPIPVGGGLLYVPADWVRPAEIGVEQLSSIYLSMGITPPTPPTPPAARLPD
ncbi:MAG: DUF502 domain-containing protein [Candidatus Dactylopiibacterium sp.]|nr:DUF502 domain-containing protein [Candidatus Dactylopiibacterium sp.]